MLRHCLNTACHGMMSNKTSINAYYNHIKLITHHVVRKILFVVKCVINIMKYPVQVYTEQQMYMELSI